MLGLIRYNIKLLMTSGYYVGWLFLLCLPFVFSFRLLMELELSKITEQVFVVVGIIWMCSAANQEKSAGVEDVVNQMSMSQGIILIIRLCFIGLSMGVGFAMLLGVAFIQGAEFSFVKLFASSMIGACTLGLIALFFSQLTQEIAIGYMISIAYFFMELSTKGSITKGFYLFGLISDNPEKKLLLVIVCLALLSLNIMLVRYRGNEKQGLVFICTRVLFENLRKR